MDLDIAKKGISEFLWNLTTRCKTLFIYRQKWHGMWAFRTYRRFTIPYYLIRLFPKSHSTISQTMAPKEPLPYADDFANVDEYVDSLLQFSAASTVFQTMCGGVHILDFFTRDKSLYHTVIPEEWRAWLMGCDSMDLLDFLMRDDISQPRADNPPESLLKYVRDIRKHSLRRTIEKERISGQKLPKHVAVGMIPKKIHEVANFSSYVSRVADSVSTTTGKDITHFVDFGSGQNYLGRTLASPPYNRHIVAVESKGLNISGAKSMDVLAGVAMKEKVIRNKKVYRASLEALSSKAGNSRARKRAAVPLEVPQGREPDLRPNRELATIYTPGDGKGYIQYVEHRIQDGDLSDVVDQIERLKVDAPAGEVQLTTSSDTIPDSQLSKVVEEISASDDTRLMAISIHSCGNLSHHGIRSLVMNPSVHAIAIVGCCYNLLTERLGPPTHKLPHRLQNLRAINAPRLTRDANARDPHGFPMSTRLEASEAIRLNITARMMAVQAPQNWTEKESDAFFTRHYYRALLQRIFLDRGVVALQGEEKAQDRTDPVIIGSLRKSCYSSFKTYVRGALEKLSADTERGPAVTQKMGDISDEEIDKYAQRYKGQKRELSITWSLMAFSAGVTESLIVVDRWLFLKEHDHIVGDCWVEPVFDYGLSPRNLVVVGIKK